LVVVATQPIFFSFSSDFCGEDFKQFDGAGAYFSILGVGEKTHQPAKA